jgi:thioesterase domain-containing protein
VAHYVEEIRRIQPEGPYAVAGWCAAGPLTVEVARQLTDAGEEMEAVILFDSWLPGYLESIEGGRQGASWLLNPAVIRSRFRHFQAKTGTLSGRRKLQYLANSLGRIAREGRDRLFIRHWSQLHRLSTRFHMPLPQFMYNTSLKTFAALQQYRERLVPIQLTLVRASDAREVKGAGAACGWDRVAEKGVNVTWAPGSHETMFIGRNLEATAAIVRATLAAAASPDITQGQETHSAGTVHGAGGSMMLVEGQA